MALLRARPSYEPAIGSPQPRISTASSSLKLMSGLSLCLAWLPFAAAAPTALGLHRSYTPLAEDDLAKSADNPGLWVYLGTAAALVLLGGAFAGLTIALMGQDEIYLQVIATSGEGSEKDNARKVLNLLKKGKHWVLVTLLLSNVITNETLPIVLDRSLGGGWPAVLGSTVLIVIFGEIAPQSICVRYGLPIGAFMSPFVLLLMWILSPVAWPTAKLLDYLLGQDHGTTYKKAGLKTLVTLHRTLGTAAEERLNKDEVTIISAVLDLKEKTVGSIMTPMQDVFTLSADTVLDEEMMNRILAEGYSRIPIHSIESKTDFVGMLLVKMLITYDPEDSLKVRDFPLATLPETRPETSCLDIINFFQEGKSHMILVSEDPGEASGALGVVTLEDVIEELIGEEIIDESDVFIDVHKAIRRLHPAPRFKVPKGEIVEQRAPMANTAVNVRDEDEITEAAKDIPKPSSDACVIGKDGVVPSPPSSRKPSLSEIESRSPTGTTLFMRRRSSGPNEPMAVRSTDPVLRQHLKHLGPSNVASRPKPTQIKSVKIKPGVSQMATLPETRQLPIDGRRAPSRAQSLTEPAAETNDERTSLLSRISRVTAMSDQGGPQGLSAGWEASDAVQAIGYGTLSTSPTAKTGGLPPRAHTLIGVNKEGELPSRPPQMEPSSPKSKLASAVFPEPADADDLLVFEANNQRSGRNHEEGQGQGNQQAFFPTPRAARSSSPSPTRVRLEFQNKTDTPDARIRFSSEAETQPSKIENEDGVTLEGPQKLVIELERQNSRTSEVSEHESGDTLGSLHSFTPSASSPNGSVTKLPVMSMQARSGSITEQVIDVGGLKKVVLEAQPSSSDDDLGRESPHSRAKSGSSSSKTSPEGPKGKEKSYTNGGAKLPSHRADEEEDADGTGHNLAVEEAHKKKKRVRRGKKKHKGKKISEDTASTGADT